MIRLTSVENWYQGCMIRRESQNAVIATWTGSALNWPHVDSSLIRLPPCEATFKQHELRTSLQTKIWMNAHETRAVIGSPLQYGWKEGKFGLEPVLFEGQMSSDFLQDLVCTCKGKSVCSRGCVCFEHNLFCTELCSCQASDLCCNINTHKRDLEDEDS